MVEQGPYDLFVEPSGTRLDGGLGYISVGTFISAGREKDFAAAGNAVIAGVDQPPACGWVVDLRLNGGGSYSPMIAAVGPLLQEGTFFGFRTASGEQTWITWDGGRVVDDGYQVADYSAELVADLAHEDVPVAVLTSSWTGSSGEVATLAFVGQAGSRSFGETTGGLTTGNGGFSLFDGASLALAQVAMTDRDGQTYMDGIPPDEPVVIDWQTCGTDDDPVLGAAMDWLATQPGCASGT
ncbi:MAG TPA: S41 family peptidase [Thermomicrobiales bacterium]|jgi:C-terminal processing protease CtpA/Prc|nr:S41 family peptidase [Thermomicrobiales bacterium]